MKYRPWFNKDYKKAINLRKIDLCKFNNEPTTNNLIDHGLTKTVKKQLI